MKNCWSKVKCWFKKTFLGRSCDPSPDDCSSGECSVSGKEGGTDRAKRVSAKKVSDS